MFLSNLNRPHRIPHRLESGARVASYIAAAAAGAVGVALWRRAAELGRTLRRTAARPILRTIDPSRSPASLANAGWAEITDAHGAVLGRARVMLAADGQPAQGQPLAGELGSLRLAPGVLRLIPGRYWVRFEASQSAHTIEVSETAGDSRTDAVPIHWDDLDLPASLVERAAN